MKLVALTICRNAAWTLRASLANVLRYCDAAVVLDHASTDGTTTMVDEFARCREVVYLRRDELTEWPEQHHRQAALTAGRRIGGTHFVMADDDEMLTENLQDTIRHRISCLEAGQCLQLPWITCWRSLDRYRCDDHVLGRTFKSMAFADRSDCGWKAPDGYHQHHSMPYNTVAVRPLARGEGGWMHWQHANWERVSAKQTWYACLELCMYGSIRADYPNTLDERGLQVATVPSGWWGEERRWIDLDAPGWHAADIRRMVGERGLEYFASHGVEVTRFLASSSEG